MIETTLTPVISVGTVISAQSYKSPDVNESLTTELIQQNQVLIQPINTVSTGSTNPLRRVLFLVTAAALQHR